MSQWLPIDSAPMTEDTVLGTDGVVAVPMWYKHCDDGSGYWVMDYGLSFSDGDSSLMPTHWMSIPDVP